MLPAHAQTSPAPPATALTISCSGSNPPSGSNLPVNVSPTIQMTITPAPTVDIVVDFYLSCNGTRVLGLLLFPVPASNNGIIDTFAQTPTDSGCTTVGDTYAAEAEYGGVVGICSWSVVAAV